MSPALLLLAAVPSAAPADLSLPQGFTAKLVADNPVAPDIYTMTIDDAGRVLVAGRGYVRVLVDDNGDGTADRAIDLIDGLKEGPMGLLAEGESLYVVVDGGLKRYRGYDGKSKLKNPETILALKTGGEHDAHAVRRGPDGWLYLLCGNMAGVKKATITSKRSPVKEPIAGALLRISPDPASGGREPTVVEVVADGFRNPYSFDFDLNGEPFTYDSDNERCVGLPWYEPCRFYHVVSGGNYGWRSPQLGQFWRKPPYFVDCVPPVCYLGRGSPTGVACYRHTHFPEKYRGGFFLADWTFGRIHFVPLTEHFSTYRSKPEVFAEATGTSGFAPTALAVHPKTGELYVSIGGRGTRGGVYRIIHDDSPVGKPLPMEKRSLDWNANAAKQWLADSTPEWFPFYHSPAAARTARQALELIVRWREKMPWGERLFAAVKPNLNHADPLIRAAAGRAVVEVSVTTDGLRSARAKLAVAFAEATTDPDYAIEQASRVLQDRESEDRDRLDAVRIIQIACGDLTSPRSVGTVFEGYTFRRPPQKGKAIEDLCIELLPKVQGELHIEIMRTLVALESQKPEPFHGAVLAYLRGKNLRMDLHYFIALGGLPYRSGAALRHELAEILLNLNTRAVDEQLPRDTFWPLRMNEVAEAIGERIPIVADKVLSLPGFGRPEDLWLVKPLKIEQLDAAKAVLAVAATESNYHWSPGAVGLLGALPADITRPVLLRLWEKPGLSDAVLRALAKSPQKADYELFVSGLNSVDSGVIAASANVLGKVPRMGQTELVAAVKALRRLAPEEKSARTAVRDLLRAWTGEKFEADPKAWSDWLKQTYPVTARLLDAEGFDAAAWKKRETAIPWEEGDATRGRAAFAKASCAACHDTGRAIGPSLLGVAKRFGRDDLLTSIVQPGKDVSPRYRPVRVTTTDEKVFLGMIVYEATDGVILQTDAETTVRIAGEKISSKRPVDASLMPAGLIDKLTDAEIADLFAYLRSLDEPSANPKR